MVTEPTVTGSYRLIQVNIHKSQLVAFQVLHFQHFTGVLINNVGHTARQRFFLFQDPFLQSNVELSNLYISSLFILSSNDIKHLNELWLLSQEGNAKIWIVLLLFIMELDYHNLAQACGFGNDRCDFVLIALNAYKITSQYYKMPCNRKLSRCCNRVFVLKCECDTVCQTQSSEKII